MLGWDSQKIEDLISEEVYKIVRRCRNFQEIEFCYEKNPDKIRKVKKQLCYTNCLRFGIYIDVEILTWNEQKIEDLFSKNVSKIIDIFYNFDDIEECYNINSEKTRKIINRLCDESCPELGVYVNPNVFYWGYQEMKDLFSNDISNIVKNGCEFATIRICYEKNPDKILAIINQICKSGFPEFGKNIDDFVFQWDDQKTKDLFLDNVWKIVRKCKNFNEIEKCYDSDPEKTFKIIN